MMKHTAAIEMNKLPIRSNSNEPPKHNLAREAGRKEYIIYNFIYIELNKDREKDYVVRSGNNGLLWEEEEHSSVLG